MILGKIFNIKILFAFFIFFMIYLIMKNKNETFESHHSKKHKIESNVCRGYLSDKDYLKHMIPHHQVAVDISIELQKITKSPVMHEILRKLIYNQKMEILIMKNMIKRLPKNISADNKTTKMYQSTVSDFIKPNKLELTNTYCDPHFFNPKSHMDHLKHINLNDVTYIEHMIPHHQVAVDMSKVLLKNTNNDFMIYLAYRIIRNQQAEIVMLDNLLNKSKISYQSKLF